MRPGPGACFRCGRRWNRFIRPPQPHITTYDKFGNGCFSLCDRCWNVLTPDSRLGFYRALWRSWFQRDGGERADELLDRWNRIEAAVKAGR